MATCWFLELRPMVETPVHDPRFAVKAFVIWDGARI